MGGTPTDQYASGTYLPIAEHGLIGDLRSVALVGTDGTIDWYCCGAFDAPSVFASILDAERGGCFELAAAVPARTKQFYFPDTNVLITRFFTEDGVGEVQDFMPVDGGSVEAERHRLIRRVVCVRGSIPFRARVAPRFDYGAQPHTARMAGDVAVFESAELSLGLTATVPLEIDGLDARADFKLAEGESTVFALDQVGGAVTPRRCARAEAEEQFSSTVAYWRHWLSASKYRGRWREMVHRSALTLKLLTYAPTGAIVAAPTTSLPEQIGGERNWDYRYVWVRDAAFCVYALLRLGFTGEAEAFMKFLTRYVSPCDGGQSGPLQIMYGIDGRTDLPERELDHLEGHQGSAPVRVGNAAADQLQLDIYGALIDSIYLYDKWAEPISSDQWDDVCALVDWVCENWDQPDEGVWETRGGRRKFPVLAADVLGGDRAGDPDGQSAWSARRPDPLAGVPRHDLPADHAAWLVRGAAGLRAARGRRRTGRGRADDAADEVHRPHRPQVAVHAGRAHPGTGLRLAGLPLRPGGQPRRTARRRGHVLHLLVLVRRGHGARRAGRRGPAGLREMLTYANHLGLYAEEISNTGEQQGNFPQAFTHLALISAAFNLDRALG